MHAPQQGMHAGACEALIQGRCTGTLIRVRILFLQALRTHSPPPVLSHCANAVPMLCKYFLMLCHYFLVLSYSVPMLRLCLTWLPMRCQCNVNAVLMLAH